MIRLFFLLLLLTACNPLQPPKPDAPAIPESYSATADSARITLEDRWWTEFHSPELDGLQERLFSENLDLAQALYRLEQLEATRRLAAANRLPSLTLNGSVARESSPVSGGTSRATNTRLSAAAAYEIDLWNKLKDRQKAAALLAEAGQQEARALFLSLSAQLAEQYFLAVEQRRQLQLLERQTVRNEALLETVTDRYKAGLAAAGELYQARQELAALNSRRPSILTNLNQAQNMIALLLGSTPGTVRVGDQELPPVTQIGGIGLPADLLTRRPDLAAAALELEAADHELAAALAEKLPSVNLTATLGRSISRLSSGDIEGTFWNLALGLAQPLFDGGRRDAESDRRAALRAEKMVSYRQTFLQAIKEVESALVAEQNSAERLELLNRQQQISLSNLELTEANYRSGLTASDVLLNQEIAHLELLSQQLDQRRLWLSQRISLARALGGSWMTEELENRKATQNRQEQTDDRE